MSSQSLIVSSRTDLELKPSPIREEWVLEGSPTARSALLSRSEDGTASTVVWECTEGKFNWFFDIDETIHLLEGAVLIEGDAMTPTLFGPGDIVFFKKGARTRWHVRSRIRKLAFCRHVQPKMVGFAIRAASKFKRMVATSGGLTAAAWLPIWQEFPI